MTTPPPAPPSPTHPGIVILVVDDDPRTLTLLSCALSIHWQVKTASTLAEAQAALEANDAIHVLLCDHVLPDGLGLDFLLRVRHSRPEIVRVLITGHSREELVIQAINSGGIFRYLVKPFNHVELIQTMQDAVHHFEKEDHFRHVRTHYEDDTAATAATPTRVARITDATLHWSGVILLAALIITLCLLFLGSLVLFVLYLLKNALDIDLFPDHHLRDFLDLIGL